MAITDQDIRLMAAEVLADTDDGGGRMTGREVVDGQSNNLFPDVSELDRTIGRVNLRKAFPALLSANRDTYYGVNIIIDEAPRDPNVSVTMFSTGSWSDRRSDAVSRMESYLARGPKYDGYLWDQHIAGQRAILIIQRPDRELPPIGTTLVLVKDPGLASEKQQFVRVIKVSSQDRTFSVSGCSTEFTRTVVTCEISDPLQFDIVGGIPHCQDDLGERYYNGQVQSVARSKVYTTVVADAARYAGMTTLSEAAAMGAYTIKAASIFGQLVPSAQVESAITDARPHADSAIPIAAGGMVNMTTTAAWSPTSTLYVGQGIYPGSLKVTIASTTITDKAGQLIAGGGVQVGTVDYANGILRIVSGGPDYGAASKAIAFVPAAHPVRNMQTAAWDITPESRSGTVVFMLDPVAAPGSMSIHYMAQGRWYVLRDDGSGALRGTDSAYGSGTVNYSTGSVVVTLGALPDVGSSIIAVWGTSLVDNDRSGASVKAMMRMEDIDTGLDAQGKPRAIARGGLTITWTGVDGQPKTATDDGAGGLTGDATGRVHYIDRWVEFAPIELPSGGTQITVVTGYAESSTAVTGINGNVIQLAAAPKPGTVFINLPTPKGTIGLRDDGTGNLKSFFYSHGKVPSAVVGTVNYTTGECVLNTPMLVQPLIWCSISSLVGTVNA